jgi:hypothetical protein
MSITIDSPVSSDRSEQVSDVTEGRFASGTKMRQTMDAWREHSREEVHRRVAARSAKQQRDLYRADREAEGRTVRPYKWHGHVPQQPWETHEAFRKRTHRDRQRAYRGTADQWFGERADLSALSEDERKQHVRELATARQRERRQRVRDAKAGERVLSAEELAKLDELLKTTE